MNMESYNLEVFDNELDIIDIVGFGFARTVFKRRNCFEQLNDLTFFNNNSRSVILLDASYLFPFSYFLL